MLAKFDVNKLSKLLKVVTSSTCAWKIVDKLPKMGQATDPVSDVWENWTRFLFLTYHHDGWEIPLPTNAQGEPIDDIAELQKWVAKDCPRASVLWDSIRTDLVAKAKEYYIWKATAGLEICPVTLKDEKKSSFIYTSLPNGRSKFVLVVGMTGQWQA